MVSIMLKYAWVTNIKYYSTLSAGLDMVDWERDLLPFMTVWVHGCYTHDKGACMPLLMKVYTP